MPIKKSKIVYIAIFLLFTLALFTACGVRGDHFATDRPTIKITSYTGFVDPDSAKVWVEEYGYEVAFQQEIFWSAESRHGVIKGYAYRISYEDDSGNTVYIPTPGNDFIDEDGSATPDVLRHLGSGWVLHYIKGTQDTRPLDDPESQRTVWTDVVKTIVNFPSHDGSGEGGEFGKPEYRSSKFEVIAIDNFGKISDIAEKYFYTTSTESHFFISSSRGAFEFSSSNPVGTGIRLQFVFNSNRIGVVPTRDWYYLYRIYKREIGTERIFEVTDPEDPNTWLLRDSPDDVTWYSTINEPNVREKVVTKYTRDGPKLASDWQDGSLNYYTVLEAKLIDLAGVVTELKDDDGEVVVERFYITDRYKPAAVFYMTHTYVLGDYHFVPNFTDMLDNKDILPSITSPTGIRHSTPFVATPVFSDSIYFNRPNFKDTIADMKWPIVGNENTNFWFRWGYRGEYETENPNNKLDKKVLDSTTGDDYKSEIAFFYLQLNGYRYPFQPLLEPRAQAIIIQDDPYWLKVPANHEIAQKLYLKNFSYGTHTLKVKVEDLQGAISEEATLKFELEAPIDPANRQGILYINNNLTYNTNIVTPLKEFYDYVLPAGYPITFINRNDLRDNWFKGFDTDVNPYKDRDVRLENYLLSYSLLQQYKYVIYGYESFSNVNNTGSLLNDIEGLRMYMDNGGSVIIVGNAQLPAVHKLMGYPLTNPDRFWFINNYFGFPVYDLSDSPPDEDPQSIPLGTSMTNRRYYFKGANPQPGTGLPYLKAETNNPPDINQGYAASILSDPAGRPRNGLLSVTFFRSIDESASPLYLFDCKDVGEDNFSPTATDPKSDYHDTIVGFRKNVGQSTNYVFGVPLFHLDRDHVRTVLQNIIQ